MKLENKEKIVKYEAVIFDDGLEIDSKIILDFINDHYDYEHTIGKDGNWTDDYIYFETFEEQLLEPILLEHDVIRLSPAHKEHNENLNKGIVSYGDEYYRYWLSDNYHKFVDEFYKLLG